PVVALLEGRLDSENLALQTAKGMPLAVGVLRIQPAQSLVDQRISPARLRRDRLSRCPLLDGLDVFMLRLSFELLPVVQQLVVVDISITGTRQRLADAPGNA